MSRESIHQHEGNKYLRTICPADGEGPGIKVDVYEVLKAFNVHCPATQHAIKKLLCAGLRRKGERIDDLKGAMAALNRAIDFDERQRKEENEAHNAVLGDAPKKVAKGFLKEATKKAMEGSAMEESKRKWMEALSLEPKTQTHSEESESCPIEVSEFTIEEGIKHGPLPMPKESPEFPVKYEGETVGKVKMEPMPSKLEIKYPEVKIDVRGDYEIQSIASFNRPLQEGDLFVFKGLKGTHFQFEQTNISPKDK